MIPNLWICTFLHFYDLYLNKSILFPYLVLIVGLYGRMEIWTKEEWYKLKRESWKARNAQKKEQKFNST